MEMQMAQVSSEQLDALREEFSRSLRLLEEQLTQFHAEQGAVDSTIKRLQTDLKAADDRGHFQHTLQGRADARQKLDQLEPGSPQVGNLSKRYPGIDRRSIVE